MGLAGTTSAPARRGTTRWPGLVPWTLATLAALAVAVVLRALTRPEYGTSWTRWLMLAVVVPAAVTQVGALRWRWPRDRPRFRVAWTLLTLSALLLLGVAVVAAIDPGRIGFWLDVGYFAGSPLFVVGLFLLPTPAVRDGWERALDAVQGLVAGLAVAVATLWLLPGDLTDGVSADELVHTIAVAGTTGVLCYVAMRQRRPGGLAVAQLQLILAAALQITVGAVLGYWYDTGASPVVALLGLVLFVTGCLTGAQAAGRDPIEAEDASTLRRREWWALLLPAAAIGLGLGSLGWYALQPESVPSALGWPMALLVAAVVLSILAVYVLGGQEARRLRAAAAERELETVVQEGWFRSLTGDSGDATLLVTPGGRIVYATPGVGDLLGLDPDVSLTGQDLGALLDVDPADWSRAVATSTRAQPARCAARVRAADPADAAELALTVSVLEDGGGLQALMVSVEDGQAHDRLTETLRLTDGLTGLPNRLGFLRACAHDLDEEEGAAAIVVLDLARFGLVNDTLGHDAGDALLRRVAAAVGECLACGGRVAGRVGGDEFAVLVTAEDVRPAPGGAVTEFDGHIDDSVAHLRALLEPLGGDRGDGLPMACHVGYCVRESADQSADELLRRAEAAAERARAGAVVAPVRFDPEHHARRLADVGLEAELRQALRSGGLVLHYQPVVDLATGRPHGVEALVRWEHPTRGLLGPDAFVPIAEARGLSDGLTRWVLETALGDHALLEAAAGRALSIAVNVGAPSVTADLVPTVELLLREHGVDSRRLVVEVTESALFTRIDDAIHALTALRAAGVSVALDDFGTGYSSLSLLTRLPVDVLKVDRSFVGALETSGDALALVRGVLQLSRTLRLTSVAEGVETEAQTELLVAMGCDHGQGYLFARPMPLEQVRGWLAAPGNRRFDPDRIWV